MQLNELKIENLLQINEITMKHETNWWLERLEANNIGCCAINSLEEVFSDPQVIARNMVINMTGTDGNKNPYKLIANPIKMKDGSISYRRPPPELGEHTSEILQEYLGLDNDTIQELKESGVI